MDIIKALCGLWSEISTTTDAPSLGMCQDILNVTTSFVSPSKVVHDTAIDIAKAVFKTAPVDSSASPLKVGNPLPCSKASFSLPKKDHSLVIHGTHAYYNLPLGMIG
jgi:hypothetical protein